MKAGVVAAVLVFVACSAGARLPRTLQGYDVLVSGRDTVSQALAQVLRERGVRVRREVRGGSRPTAALIHFTYREPPPASSAATLTWTWLHARLFDTRSGVILGAATLRLERPDSPDSIGARGRAAALVDSLLSP